MLHKKKLINEESKMCNFYDDLNKTNENFNYKNLYKSTNIKNNKIEFIPLKTVLISMINLSGEMINHYIKKYLGNNINRKQLIYLSSEEETNAIIQMIESNLFETLYNDCNFACNMCDFLKNNFIECINDFNQKYKMSFKLRELLKDIFGIVFFISKFYD